jgi:carbonic anhydrase/acetyltransferase-like protein (isoleucine patch superfamily)
MDPALETVASGARRAPPLPAAVSGELSRATTLVYETAVLIGDVRIGADYYIDPHAVCRGDQGRS